MMTVLHCFKERRGSSYLDLVIITLCKNICWEQSAKRLSWMGGGGMFMFTVILLLRLCRGDCSKGISAREFRQLIKKYKPTKAVDEGCFFLVYTYPCFSCLFILFSAECLVTLCLLHLEETFGNVGSALCKCC